MIYEHLLATGEYLGARRTGRSTAMALSYIAQAMKTPGVPVYVHDHWDSSAAHTLLLRRVEDVIERLELKHFKIVYTDLYIQFGD